MVQRVRVQELAASTDWLAVDVRPFEERYGGLGFIPGSLHVPRERAEEWILNEINGAPGVVLVCLTGQRSDELVGLLTEGTDAVVGSLDGGVLGWLGADLPVACESRLVAKSVGTVEPMLKREVQACFVGQFVSMMADMPGGDAIDPMDVLRQCFQAEGARLETATRDELCRVLDRAALVSRRIGSPLAAIAENLDRLLAKLS